MAATQYSVRVVKTFPFRGDPLKEFSNRYYFDGGNVGDSSAWTTFFDALVLLEKTIHLSDAQIVACLGYAPGSDVAVASKTYTTAGTLTLSGAALTPGECSAILRMATTKRSTKNHPVYVFSYYHHVAYTTASGSSDVLAAGQKTAIESYGNQWLTGFSVAGRTYKRTTPDGHATTGRVCDTWIGHRDFPR